jgi:hypothetical protein
MADETDVLVQQWLSRWEQIRHLESQRATMTNMILILASAGIGYVAQKRIEPRLLTVSGALIVLGMFGALASAKYYERFKLHLREARVIRQKIDERFPLLELSELADITWHQHTLEFSRLARIPLYGLWIALHVGITLAGLLITSIILAQM